jgi:phage gp36-like protein
MSDIFNDCDDKELKKQFLAIDKLSESEVRFCCKKAYGELKQGRVFLEQEAERYKTSIARLEEENKMLRDKIACHKDRILKLFDL